MKNQLIWKVMLQNLIMLNDKPGLIDFGNEYLFLDVLSTESILFFLKIYVNEKSVFMKVKQMIRSVEAIGEKDNIK